MSSTLTCYRLQSRSELRLTRLSADIPVTKANNDSSGLHAAARIPKSMDPTVSGCSLLSTEYSRKFLKAYSWNFVLQRNCDDVSATENDNQFTIIRQDLTSNDLRRQRIEGWDRIRGEEGQGGGLVHVNPGPGAMLETTCLLCFV